MNREIFLDKRREYRELLINDFKKRVDKLLQYSGKDYVLDIEFSNNYESYTSAKITYISRSVYKDEIRIGLYNNKCSKEKTSLNLENLPTDVLEQITSENIIGFGTDDWNYYRYNEEL